MTDPAPTAHHDPVAELNRLADTSPPAVAATLRRAARGLPFRAPEILGHAAAVLREELTVDAAEPLTISTACRLVATAGNLRAACEVSP